MGDGGGQAGSRGGDAQHTAAVLDDGPDLPAGGAENHELFDFILENGFVQVIDTGLAQDRIDQA